MRRTERLFALAEYLRGRRTGVTAQSLADRFDVTLRTIYRDLDSLRAADLPIQADRGVGGGYALDRAYSLPPVNFSAREAALLVTAGRLLVELRLLPFVDTLEGALDKVRAALPPATQRELERLAGSLTFVGVPAKSCKPETRRAIEQAWFERRPLRIVYQGSRGPTARTVRLDQVVMERTEVLLNCTDLDIGEPRQFKLHLISEAEVADVEP